MYCHVILWHYMWSYDNTCDPMTLHMILRHYFWSYDITCVPLILHVILWQYMWSYYITCDPMTLHVILWHTICSSDITYDPLALLIGSYQYVILGSNLAPGWEDSTRDYTTSRGKSGLLRQRVRPMIHTVDTKMTKNKVSSL